MKTLSIGKANGAISILHSLGLGKGTSIGIELITEVSIVDEKREVKDDFHNLLGAVESCWRSEGFPIPRDFGWDVQSSIPIGQGLKSSSALASAAFRALNNLSWTGDGPSKNTFFGSKGLQERSKSPSRGFQQAACAYDASRQPCSIDFHLPREASGPQNQRHW